MRCGADMGVESSPSIWAAAKDLGVESIWKYASVGWVEGHEQRRVEIFYISSAKLARLYMHKKRAIRRCELCYWHRWPMRCGADMGVESSPSIWAAAKDLGVESIWKCASVG